MEIFRSKSFWIVIAVVLSMAMSCSESVENQECASTDDVECSGSDDQFANDDDDFFDPFGDDDDDDDDDDDNDDSGDDDDDDDDDNDDSAGVGSYPACNYSKTLTSQEEAIVENLVRIFTKSIILSEPESTPTLSCEVANDFVNEGPPGLDTGWQRLASSSEYGDIDGSTTAEQHATIIYNELIKCWPIDYNDPSVQQLVAAVQADDAITVFSMMLQGAAIVPLATAGYLDTYPVSCPAP